MLARCSPAPCALRRKNGRRLFVEFVGSIVFTPVVLASQQPVQHGQTVVWLPKRENGVPVPRWDVHLPVRDRPQPGVILLPQRSLLETEIE
jgi:hypothetical protein